LSLQPRLLLDTHVLVRWLVDARKLSKEQLRVLEAAVKRTEPVGLSAITLLEIALLVDEGKLKLKIGLGDFLDAIQGNPAFRLLPLTYEIAADIAMLGILRDPADRTIAATARVHRLSLLTSDDRIINSKLVAVID
jgi:PIN domain nuclease of toxin-antitoxin system